MDAMQDDPSSAPRSGKRRALVGLLALLAALVVAGLAWIARDRAGDLSPWPTFEIGKELSTVPGVSIRAAFDAVGGGIAHYGSTKAYVHLHSSTFRNMLEYAYRIPKGGIAWKVYPPDGVFDLSADVSSGGEDELARRLEKAFLQVFGIRGKYEPREVPVLVLGRSEKDRAALRTVSTSDRSSDEAQGSYTYQGPATELADWLQKRMGIPVLDETGVAEDIQVSLSWKKDPQKELFDSLEQNGLSLEKAIRTVETLVVSR